MHFDSYSVISKEKYDKKNIKVSVIMPSLNVVGYIENSLESVLRQTLNDIELLCIDAGSTDGTYEILKKFAEKDRRIRLYKSPVKSYGYQVNLGLSKAIGDYLGIVETDDYVDKYMYETLYQEAVKNDLDYIKCDYDSYRKGDNEEKILTTRRISSNSLFYESVFMPVDHPETACDDWYLGNGIYKNSFINNNGIRFTESKGAAFQDIGFLHKTSVYAKRTKYLDRALYRYCIDRCDASSNSKNTIQYIRNEYGRLLDCIGDRCSIKEWTLLYARMAKSYTRAFMDCSEETLQTKDASDICRWFQVRLLNAENQGLFSEKILPIGLQRSYRHLVDPLCGYIAYRRNRDREIMDFIGRDHPLVIFGCGSYGSEAYHYLIDRGFNVEFFMDNSSALWGEIIEGIKVISPDRINDLPRDSRFIIANEKYSREIYEQLESAIGKEREYIF